MDTPEVPDGGGVVLDRIMGVLYTVSTLLLCAYIADVLTEGAVTRATGPLTSKARKAMVRLSTGIRRERQWRAEAPLVVWEAMETTMKAAGE